MKRQMPFVPENCMTPNPTGVIWISVLPNDRNPN
jgi:hypothetical protein